MKSIAVRYKGGVFSPLNPSQVSKNFKEGELYFFKADNRRYWPRHKWFMATIRSCWESLPDEIQIKYPTPDHLRKRLLIAAGYSDIVSITYDSKYEATKTAAFMGPLIDPYSVVSVQGPILVIATAKSQAVDEMDAETFKRSCDDVLDHLAVLLGTTKADIIEQHKEMVEEVRRKKKIAARAGENEAVP